MRHGDKKILSVGNVLERLGTEEKKDRPPADEEGVRKEGFCFQFGLA